KMDLGSCPKIHSERLKTEYEEAKQKKVCDFDLEFERNLGNFVSDCDRKIASAQKRLDKTPEDSAKVSQLTREIENLSTEISEMTKEVEVLGEEGKVAESMKLLQDVEAKKAAKLEKEKELKNSAEGGGPSQQQKLRVCEMHLGYLKIRDLLKELREKHKDRRSTAVEDLISELLVTIARDRDPPIDVLVEGGLEVLREEDINILL
ncbi:3007_t:CDS:2, partial [Dentiscutata erythropus]